MRVRDHANKIVYCPTTLMKADPLSKLECSISQRDLILFQNNDSVLPKGLVYNDDLDLDIEDEEDIYVSIFLLW